MSCSTEAVQKTEPIKEALRSGGGGNEDFLFLFHPPSPPSTQTFLGFRQAFLRKIAWRAKDRLHGKVPPIPCVPESFLPRSQVTEMKIW